MGSWFSVCTDLGAHCDVSLDYGHRGAVRQEAEGAHQVGVWPEADSESQPIDFPLAHNFGRQPRYKAGGSQATNSMKASSSHRHQADVARAQAARADALERQRVAAYQQVWDHLGPYCDQQFRHWEAQVTQGYLDGPLLEVEFRTVLRQAVDALIDWESLPLDSPLQEEYSVRYFYLKDRIPVLLDEMTANQSAWLSDFGP